MRPFLNRTHPKGRDVCATHERFVPPHETPFFLEVEDGEEAGQGARQHSHYSIGMRTRAGLFGGGFAVGSWGRPWISGSGENGMVCIVPGAQ